jgi:hypothetical protein
MQRPRPRPCTHQLACKLYTGTLQEPSTIRCQQVLNRHAQEVKAENNGEAKTESQLRHIFEEFPKMSLSVCA